MDTPKEIRVAWRIGGFSGGSPWRLDAPSGTWTLPAGSWRTVLESRVESGNACYGAGTHWIEERVPVSEPGA